MTSRSAPTLPPRAAVAARLEAAGAGPTEIARQTGVDERTVKRWRKRPDYRALRDKLTAEANERVIDRAMSLRLKAITLHERLMDDALAQVEELEDGEHLPVDTIAKWSKVALDAYKTTAAQTGIVETQHVEVEAVDPSAEADAAERVAAALRR